MNILVVEDNEPDQFIMKEAFKEAKVDHHLQIVNDGIEAIEFLKVSKPDLIILDLNMPKKNGLEVLSDIRANSKWGHIPILIFSNSEFPTDICRCYSTGANAYLIKPVDFQGFIDIAFAIDMFWSRLARYCLH